MNGIALRCSLVIHTKGHGKDCLKMSNTLRYSNVNYIHIDRDGVLNELAASDLVQSREHETQLWLRSSAF